MTIDHFSLALDGLKPNFSHFSFSVLGRRVSITLAPKKQPIIGGGGGHEAKKLEPDTYIIAVKVEFKGKIWHEKKEIRKSTAHIIAKLVASFKYVTSLSNKLDVAATFIKSSINNIFINIRHINKD